MNLAVETTVECAEWRSLPDIEAMLSECLSAALRVTGECVPEGAETSFLFCDDARMRELNRRFRGVDKATNVLSFPPAPASPLFLGDVALAYETIAREAREQGKSLERHSRHMIVHGFLHLLGYDHEDVAAAEEMETIEIRILQQMGDENPYSDDCNSETGFNGRT